MPKFSTETGLIYLYTKLPNAPQSGDAYYFTAIDFQSGKTVFRVLTGTGVRYDNNWAAIALAPDGTAFVGVLNGLIRVRDQSSALPVEAVPPIQPVEPAIEAPRSPIALAEPPSSDELLEPR